MFLNELGKNDNKCLLSRWGESRIGANVILKGSRFRRDRVGFESHFVRLDEAGGDHHLRQGNPQQARHGTQLADGGALPLSGQPAAYNALGNPSVRASFNVNGARVASSVHRALEVLGEVDRSHRGILLPPMSEKHGSSGTPRQVSGSA